MSRLKLYNGITFPDGTTQDTAATGGGGGGDVKLGFTTYTFDDTPTGSTISGVFTCDSGDLATALQINLNDLGLDSIDWSSLYANWEALITSSPIGTLIIRSVDDPSNYAYYDVTNVSHGGSESALTVTLTGSGGTIADTDICFIDFIPNGNAGNDGISAPLSFRIRVDLTSIADSDPGGGYLRFNHATQGSATVLRIDLTDVDSNNITAILDSLDDSTATVKGYLRLSGASDPLSSWLLYTVSAVATPSGYRNVTVAFVAQSGINPFADQEIVTLSFTRNGDKGVDGTTFSAGQLAQTSWWYGV